MLDPVTLHAIADLTLRFWQVEANRQEFTALARGKELGHRIANFVDEKTTELIANNFDTRRQRKRNGSVMPRSMGDIWVLGNGIYNPVNIKAGEANRYGQPNMVSLKKLLRALLLRQIDSYYLLIVKMTFGTRIEPSVRLVDILDYLDYVAFNSGPGQIMLKERQFYEAMENNVIPVARSIDDKIARLFSLLEDADRRLTKNRARVMTTIQDMRGLYGNVKDQPIDQSKLNLG